MPAPLPPSASSQRASIIAILLMLTVYMLRWPSEISATSQAWLAIGLFTLPLILHDFLIARVHRRESTGLDWKKPHRATLERVATKWVGLMGIWLLACFAYWQLPLYRNEFYLPYFVLILTGGPLLLAASLPYLWWVDRHMKSPEDPYYRFGKILQNPLRLFSPTHREGIGQLLLGWLVKAYFLPLMYCYLIGSMTATRNHFDALNGHFLSTYFFLFELTFMVDLTVVCIGYLYTLRLADTHIRSSEPTFFGWAVTLLCYKPFWDFFYNHYIQYSDDTGWTNWLSQNTTMLHLWGVAILLMHLIYAWSSVAFGLRFSNLTYRGTITAGPYRWTKHPAYISKNISWWLISVPFVIHESWEEALRQCLALGLNNMIYYARAKTEEAHLMRYPEYQAYAQWMQEHGLLTKHLYRIKKRLTRR